MTNLIGLNLGPIPSLLTTRLNAPDITIYNSGAHTVFLGDSSVSATTGRALLPGSSLVWSAQGDLWGVAESASTVDLYGSSGTQFDAGSIVAGLQAGGLTAAGVANAIYATGVAVPTVRETLWYTNDNPVGAQVTSPLLSVDMNKVTQLFITTDITSEALAQSQNNYYILQLDWQNTGYSATYRIGVGNSYIQSPVVDSSVIVSIYSNNNSVPVQVYINVEANNLPRHYNVVTSMGCPISAFNPGESPQGDVTFNAAINGVASYFAPLPNPVNVWNIGTVRNPGVMYEFPANTTASNVGYYFGLPNNGSGSARASYTYLSNSTAVDSIRWNMADLAAGILLPNSWQQTLDNAFSMTFNNNDPNFFDLQLPNVPMLPYLVKAANSPASKLVYFQSGAPIL